MLIKRVVLLLLLMFSCQNLFAEELIQAPAAIQISSKVSEGKYTISEIAGICREQNFKVVVITDRDLMRWEYGVWPLRNIIKKTVEDNSILKYGAVRYIREFKQAQKENPDLLIIPGVESAPFYYWTGSLFEGNLAIRDWHKHMISIGLKDSRDLEHLPVVGNKAGLALLFGPKNLILLWPLLIFGAGFLCLTKKVFSKAGVLFIIIACVFLADNFPFRFYKFDQFHGYAGIRPYQDYIDYVNRHDGLTFWAHPEAGNKEKVGEILVSTEDHSLDLLRARDYTGFAVFHEGYKTVGKINGMWDSLLKDFCAGKRNSPVWAIGALGFDSSGELKDSLKLLRTVVLLPVVSEQECLKAIKNGRMFTVLGKNSGQLNLSKFSVVDIHSGAEKTMGEELRTSQTPRIMIKADFLNGQQYSFKIKLIRNGEVIKVFEAPAPLDIAYSDEKAPAAGSFYYRLEIQSQDMLAITNPVFVKRQELK
jgi:hypothetical protein